MRPRSKAGLQCAFGVTVCAIVAALFGGCTFSAARADRISFDRGAFALAYCDFSTPVRLKCENKEPTVECVKFGTLDNQVRTAITTPTASEASLSSLIAQIMQLFQSIHQ